MGDLIGDSVELVAQLFHCEDGAPEGCDSLPNCETARDKAQRLRHVGVNCSGSNGSAGPNGLTEIVPSDACRRRCGAVGLLCVWAPAADGYLASLLQAVVR